MLLQYKVLFKKKCSSSLVHGSFFLFDLASAGLFGTVGSFDRTTDIDVEVIVVIGQVVEAAFGFGEWRQVEREVCGVTEAS